MNTRSPSLSNSEGRREDRHTGGNKKKLRRDLIHLYESSREAQKARENIATEHLETSKKKKTKKIKNISKVCILGNLG